MQFFFDDVYKPEAPSTSFIEWCFTETTFHFNVGLRGYQTSFADILYMTFAKTNLCDLPSLHFRHSL